MTVPPRTASDFAKTCVGSSVPRKLRLNTKFTPAGSRSKKVLTLSSGSPSKSSGNRYSFVVCAFGLLPPAPFRRISAPPNVSSTCARALCRLSRSSTSVASGSARPPCARMRSAVAAARSAVKSSTATFAPHSASASQKAEQSTPPPPVTTAVLPRRSILNGTAIRLSRLFPYSALFCGSVIFRCRCSARPAFHAGNRPPSQYRPPGRRRPRAPPSDSRYSRCR